MLSLARKESTVVRTTEQQQEMRTRSRKSFKARLCARGCSAAGTSIRPASTAACAKPRRDNDCEGQVLQSHTIIGQRDTVQNIISSLRINAVSQTCRIAVDAVMVYCYALLAAAALSSQPVQHNTGCMI